MAMLPPQKLSRCDYIVLMVNNTAGLWNSNSSSAALQHLRTQQVSHNTLSRIEFKSCDIGHKLCLLLGGTTPPPPLLSWHRHSQGNQHWPRWERGKEHLRAAELVGEWGNFSILCGTPECAILRNRRLSLTPVMIPHSYQSSMIILQVMLRQTEGLQHL